MTQRPPRYLLEAFGFSPWNIWLLRTGALDDFERRPPAYEEDFGDPAARAIAHQVMPALVVCPGRRIDMRAPALRGEPGRDISA